MESLQLLDWNIGKCEKKRLVFVFNVMIVLLISLPVFMYGIDGTNGQDLRFHLARIENVVDGLRNHEFPVRMGNAFNGGYGYPVSIFYGDVFLYFPALLRLLGMPVILAYKIYILVVNILSVIVGYFCFRAIYKQKWIACMVNLLYMTATYRMLDLYIRSAAGEYTAMAFIPIVVYAVYNNYTISEKHDKGETIRCVLLMAIGMSAIIYSHVLTALMVVILICIVAICFWKRTFYNKCAVIRRYIIAAFLCLLLTASYVVPFIDYLVKVDIEGSTLLTDKGNVQWRGAYIGQLFAFDQIPFGHSSLDVTERMNLTIGFPLMLVLVSAIFLCVAGYGTQMIKVGLGLSCGTLLMSTNLFPWDLLSRIPIIGKILGQIQFPWRYLGMAMICSVLLFGVICLLFDSSQKQMIVSVICLGIILCIGSISSFVSTYCNYSDIVNFQETEDLGMVNGSNYLMKNTDRAKMTYDFEVAGIGDVDIMSSYGVNYVLNCKMEDSEAEIVVPLFNYPYYNVTDSYGNNYPIYNGSNMEIVFRLPANYEGYIYIYWQEPLFWRICEIISIFAWMIILGIIIKEKLYSNRLRVQNILENRY